MRQAIKEVKQNLPPRELISNIPKLPIKYKDEILLTEKELKEIEGLLKRTKRYATPDDILLEANINFYKDLIKSLLKTTMGYYNKDDDLKDRILPRFKTIIKKEMHNLIKREPKFSIDESELEKTRFALARRKNTKFSQRIASRAILSKGRIIRYTPESIDSPKISPIPSILNGVRNGNYTLATQTFNITKHDFLFPQFSKTVSYNIMLVLDTSKSIKWIIPYVEKFVSRITSNAINTRDKLGLITFNNDVAQIYHYPTFNAKQVIGTINKMETKGFTPLGDGLEKALQVFSKDQYKRPGTKNLIILISDCFPEPLEGGHKDLLDEPVYKKVLSAAKRIKKSDVNLILINPSEDQKNVSINASQPTNWGEKLADKIIEFSGGKYIRLQTKPTIKSFRGRTIADDTFSDLSQAVMDLKT